MPCALTVFPARRPGPPPARTGHKKQACSRRKCLQLTPCKLRKLLAPPSAKRQKTAAAAAALRPVPEQSVLPHDFGPFVSPRGEAYADPTSSALTFLPIQLLSDSLMAIVPSLGDERGQAAEPAGGQAHRKGAQGYNSPSVSAQASPSIQADAFDSFVGAGLDADTEGARLDDGAELGLGASSSACALASSPLRARALALEPLPLCAVTRADVAVDSLNDAKLDWSWLALANIEVRARARPRAAPAARGAPIFGRAADTLPCPPLRRAPPRRRSLSTCATSSPMRGPSKPRHSRACARREPTCVLTGCARPCSDYEMGMSSCAPRSRVSSFSTTRCASHGRSRTWPS